MKITDIGYRVKHPNWKPFTVSFHKNDGTDSGWNVHVSMKDSRHAYEFFFNSELMPTEDDAKDYAVWYIKMSRKI